MLIHVLWISYAPHWFLEDFQLTSIGFVLVSCGLLMDVLWIPQQLTMDVPLTSIGFMWILFGVAIDVIEIPISISPMDAPRISDGFLMDFLCSLYFRNRDGNTWCSAYS